MMELDFTKLKASWTKYHIVQVMEVIHDTETLHKYVNREASIDEPTLRHFLGMNSLDAPIPEYWLEIQKYPQEKDLFAFFALIFTHWSIIQDFANEYCENNMRGVFTIKDSNKASTNLRSALVESGAAARYLRRADVVPFDFSPIFSNQQVGKLFKQVLEERIERVSKGDYDRSKFYKICYTNNFHKALSLSEEQFHTWLEGNATHSNSGSCNYISEVKIMNFFSIKEISLTDIQGSKEVYLLGENSDGKSLILMAIYLAFNERYILEKTKKSETGVISDLVKANSFMELVGTDDSGKKYGSSNPDYLSDIYAYGTHRGRYSTDNPEPYGFMSLFDSDQTLINPISWLKDQKLLETDKDKSPTQHNEKTKSSFSIKLLEEMLSEFIEKNVDITIQGDGVIFREKGLEISFNQLSDGYKSIIIFVSDLLSRLQKSQPTAKNISELKGIVLVDEIDLHLHPKWQRSLISKFRELLPNIQFIFTTHSPIMIQGASNDAVIYRVYRNSEDGQTRVSDPYFRKNLNHLMINTLLTSPLFGLENSRLDSENNMADTSESYLYYKIHEQLNLALQKQKKAGKEFVSDKDVNNILEQIIAKEFENND